MNRPLKFRTFWKRNKEMIYFDLSKIQEGKVLCSTEELLISLENNETMQFTGLLDKNGKEIFEGDIVEVDYSSSWDKNKIVLVEYDQKLCGFIPFIYQEDESYRAACRPDQVKIIGNVWETPELLKVKRQ